MSETIFKSFEPQEPVVSYNTIEMLKNFGIAALIYFPVALLLWVLVEELHWITWRAITGFIIINWLYYRVEDWRKKK